MCLNRYNSPCVLVIGYLSSFLMQFEPFLVSQLQNTKFSSRSNPSYAPLCSPTPGSTLLNAFSDVARTNPPVHAPLTAAPQGSRDEEAATQKQLRHVLELMVVLWGDLPSQCSTGELLWGDLPSQCCGGVALGISLGPSQCSTGW